MPGSAGEVTAGPSRAVLRLVLLAISLRGVGYALLTPTYEGWDEYQHLAYFEHLADGGLPHLGASVVPPAVLRDVGRGPVPPALASQAPASRLQTYKEYWRSPKPGGESAVALYEAQHAPWYYFLHSPIHLLLARDDFFWVVRTQRLANLGWTLAGVGFAAIVFRRAGVARPVAEGALALLAAHSLFLMAYVRTANDAPAFALCCLGVALALRTDARHSATESGCMLAIAGAVKATAWTVAPAVIVLWRQLTERRTLVVSFLASFALIVSAAVIFDWQRHGRFALTQEAWLLSMTRRGNLAVWDAAWGINWFDEFSSRWGRHLLWVGGWSFVSLPRLLPRLHQWLLLASLAPMAVRLYRGELRNKGFGAFCLLACFGVAVGQAVHMAQSKAALGFVATPAWYAVIALPWLFAGLVWSWGLNERLQRIALAAFFGLLLVSEIVGVFCSWLPTFADSTEYAVVVERCMKLAGGAVYFWVGVLGFVLGWAAAILALRQALRTETT